MKNYAALYRRNAEDCRRKAERAHTPERRARWLKIAEDWLRLAEQVQDEAPSSAPAETPTEYVDVFRQIGGLPLLCGI
jgi:hypothetical protein